MENGKEQNKTKYHRRIFSWWFQKVTEISTKKLWERPRPRAHERNCQKSWISEHAGLQRTLTIVGFGWRGFIVRSVEWSVTDTWSLDVWICYIPTHQAWTNTVVSDSHSGMPLIPRKFNQVWLSVGKGHSPRGTVIEKGISLEGGGQVGLTQLD